MGRGYRSFLLHSSCPREYQLLCSSQASVQPTLTPVLEGPANHSRPPWTHTESPGLTITKVPFYLRLILRTKQTDLPCHSCTFTKLESTTNILYLIWLTWFKIPLYNQLILLLISSSNDEVILRTNEPQELLKPAKLRQSIVWKTPGTNRTLQRYFLYQTLRISIIASTTYKRSLLISYK